MNPEQCGLYDEGDHVSFVGRPFPLEEAYEHFSRIKLWGHNTLRYIITWEALEHEGPGIYDDDYINYTIEILKIIKEIGGLYVFIDPHQDVWSRFTGGSGAPMWTLYAAGLEPRNFSSTGAATLHNCAKDPSQYTKMVWATNYYKLASEVMFTMFFSGKLFLPRAIINGVNIQDYLQDHFIGAVDYFLKRVREKAPELFETVIIGVETMNEPNTGLYGFPNLNEYPKDQELKLDASPTAIQGMRLGMGYSETVEEYYLSVFGPRKRGTVEVDPKGLKAWVTNDKMDKHYGFNRDPRWKLGECIFAQHGIWNSHSGKLLIPNYFAVSPNDGRDLDISTFVNENFVDFYSKYKTMVNNFDSELFVVLQQPVFEIPPNLKGTSLVDKKTISAHHYYDGMSLMFKTWNRRYNVDTLGIMRGRYLNPVFGLVFGEANIRRSLRKQLGEMRIESNEKLGESVPVIMTEIGMPFDMDDKHAYITGDYSSQESANDALLFALEGNALNFTYWCYNPENNHDWGDNWNLEDFSLYSKDDAHDGASEVDTSNYGSYLEWITNAGSLASSSSGGTAKTKKIHYQKISNGPEYKSHFQSDKSGYMPVEEMELESKLLSILQG
ncbi:unnamed protein product [Ambrosiozyma monospora]|uniref:Unnamed protein product n=1 Tax=Ambrosiozyma monospora TaxID=43982 RepID=A0ACB5U0Z8_AMBMO|nr:unnamed protein product [Ambrosiozyma monospora]